MSELEIAPSRRGCCRRGRVRWLLDDGNGQRWERVVAGRVDTVIVVVVVLRSKRRPDIFFNRSFVVWPWYRVRRRPERLLSSHSR